METLAISINDAARTLSLGRTSIYVMIADGRLEAFKLGRRTLVKADSVRRLVAERGGHVQIPVTPPRMRTVRMFPVDRVDQ